MNFDLSELGTLAGTLAAQNAPLIGNLFTTVAGMAGTAVAGPVGGAAAGFVAKGLSSLILSKLGEGLGTPPDPAAINTAIEADPAKAAPVIQQVENDHAEVIKATLDAANRELEIVTSDIGNARDMQEKLSDAKSPMAWMPATWSLVMLFLFSVVLFVLVVALVLPYARQVAVDTSLLNVFLVVLGVLLNEVARGGSFWLGSTKSSHDKSEQLANLYKNPTIQAQPGSHVTAGSITGTRK